MIAAIIQARMSSSRLPGKIMLRACGKTMLELMIERVQKAHTLDKILVATTINPADDIIVNLCKDIGVQYFRGPEEDVLLRYKLAADVVNADTIVRLSSDCPLIDPIVIDKIVNVYVNGNFDFVNNLSPLPRTYPDGMMVEVFSKDLLNEINREAIKPSHREHVTFFMWMQPNRYKIHRVDYEKDLSQYRLNLDYAEDYDMIKSVFENLYEKDKFFTMEDTINWLNAHPKILELNSHIVPNQGWLKSFEKDKQTGFT